MVPIDIMMPFYGDAEQFRLAVESVRAQSSPDWRLVIIDDCYPGDAHVRVLDAIDDSRITMVRNPRNLGVAGSFQRAIDLSEATHLVIMGCDDIMRPDYVLRATELIELHPDADYFQPGVVVIDDAGAEALPLADRVKRWYRPRHGTTELTGESLALSLLRGNWTYFPSILWRRSTIARYGFRDGLDVVLDLALQLDIVTGDGTLVVDDQPVFSYRRHASSVSSERAVDGRRFAEERQFFREAEERCERLGWRRAARAARHHWSSRLNALTRLPAALASRDREGARALLQHAMRLGAAPANIG